MSDTDNQHSDEGLPEVRPSEHLTPEELAEKLYRETGRIYLDAEALQQSLKASKEEHRKKVSDLEQKLNEEREEKRQATEEIERLNRRLDQTRKLQDYLNRQGRTLRSLLERRDTKHAFVRANELNLISRYCSNIGKDAELIERFGKHSRRLSWTQRMFFEPLYQLDHAEQNMGQSLYAYIVKHQAQLAVVDMEALAQYTHQVIEHARVNDVKAIQTGAEVGKLLANPEGKLSAEYLKRARDVYRTNLRQHHTAFQALDAPEERDGDATLSGVLLQLREEVFDDKWERVIELLDDMERTEKITMVPVPILGMQPTPISAYRSKIKAMQEYHAEHKIDFAWFYKLPTDLAAFIK